jgi:hypothetical protein
MNVEELDHREQIRTIFAEVIPTTDAATFVYSLINRKLLNVFSISHPKNLPYLIQDIATPALGNEYLHNAQLGQNLSETIKELLEMFDPHTVTQMILFYCADKLGLLKSTRSTENP